MLGAVHSRDRATSIAGICDLRSDPPVLKPFQLPSSRWYSIALSRSGAAFLSTENGDLFWLDMAVPATGQPIYFGIHPEGRAGWLQCPDDGSLVVAAGAHLTAWDHSCGGTAVAAFQCIRHGCAFVPRSRRLICGLESGEVVELDPRTGDRLRLIARYPSPIYLPGDFL